MGSSFPAVTPDDHTVSLRISVAVWAEYRLIQVTSEVCRVEQQESNVDHARTSVLRRQRRRELRRRRRPGQGGAKKSLWTGAELEEHPWIGHQANQRGQLEEQP